MGIKKFQIIQNLWNVAKAGFRGKCIALNTLIDSNKDFKVLKFKKQEK